MEENNKSITLIAKVNITYKGESRIAAVYNDRTAILDTGEAVTLSESQFAKVMEKWQKAKDEEDEKAALEAAKAAEEEAEKARKAAERKARKKAAREKAAMEAEEEEKQDAHLRLPRRSYREEFSNVPKRPSLAMIAAATLVYVAVIGGTLFGSTYLLDNYMNKVSVAQLSTQMAKDSQFTPDNLKQLKMPESVYAELNKSAPGGLVLWEDAQGIVGQYIAMDAVKGQYLSYDFVSESRTMANPWIQNLDDDAQLYTIQFDPYQTYQQLLFAGSHVRMKAAMTHLDENGRATPQTSVCSISEAAADYRVDDDEKEEEKAKVDTPKENEEGSEANADGEPQPDENKESEGEKSPETPKPSKPSKAEIKDRFDDIVVVDIINTSNESMFDVYLPLARMTRDDRREFLTEKAKSSGAAAYYARFTPMSLVFALDDTQVSELSKVENMTNAKITYTLLPSSSNEGSAEENSMYLKFMEVQRDVNEIFGDAMATQ